MLVDVAPTTANVPARFPILQTLSFPASGVAVVVSPTRKFRAVMSAPREGEVGVATFELQAVATTAAAVKMAFARRGDEWLDMGPPHQVTYSGALCQRPSRAGGQEAHPQRGLDVGRNRIDVRAVSRREHAPVS
jgi:hypothetical protein